MPITIGQPAPSFRLPDQEGKDHAVSDYLGKWVVLYFYPKDDTHGCTKEACGFRDRIEEVREAGAVVLGVSADSQASHKRFAEKYHLPFTLLADPRKEVIRAYDASRSLWTKRISYLIDPDGKIARVYETVHPDEHAQEVLNDIKKFHTESHQNS